MTPGPREVLTVGAESLAGWLQPDGTVQDPVFGCPTQYGSAYYGWCCAVLSGVDGPDAEVWWERAARILTPGLAHTADPDAEPYASGFDRRTLSVTGRLNHRDFTWPPILKTWLALSGDRRIDDEELRARLRSVDVESSFRSRPPSNWAAVWLSGEWLRMRAGLSPTTPEQFDDWLDVFFTADGDAGLDLELGMYLERGLPNSYDLFTRAHFTDLLVQGYAGRNRDRLAAFLTTGLRRSLALQLSDGSLASGYRSAGQTWVLGAQISLFTGSRVLGLGSADDQESARLAAWRAFDSFARWQRPDGAFSPVQNLLPSELRVGYEAYTSDGHYAPLALGFLASALVLGFGDDPRPTRAELDGRRRSVRVEGAPTHRGVVQRGRISVAVQAQADDTYDATGLVDLTFGTGRRWHQVTAARHLSGGPWLVPGLALRERPWSSAVTALGGWPHRLTSALVAERDGMSFGSVVALAENTQVRHELTMTVTPTGVEVSESTPGRTGSVSLLVPYLRDLGGGNQTVVMFTDTGVRFTMGEEWVEFAVTGPVERHSDLPYGYESRRGLCGLVRLDVAEPTESLRWTVTSGPEELGRP